MVDVLIAKLDRWLAENRPKYYALLHSGVMLEELDAFEQQFGLRLPDAFRQLYRWRDGQDPNSSASLHRNRSFSPLCEIAETKELLDGMIGEDFDDPRYWRRSWVPFLHNGGGSHLCVDVAAEDGGHSGQLVGFWKADLDRPVEFESVEAWLANVVASMQSGSLRLVESGEAG